MILCLINSSWIVTSPAVEPFLLCDLFHIHIDKQLTINLGMLLRISNHPGIKSWLGGLSLPYFSYELSVVTSCDCLSSPLGYYLRYYLS